MPNTELGFLFCIAQNAKWTDSENNKQGFALDVIFQNKAICNFCLKKNVLLFFREARNAYFIFRELWKDHFIFREKWSRPLSFTTNYRANYIGLRDESLEQKTI